MLKIIREEIKLFLLGYETANNGRYMQMKYFSQKSKLIIN